MIRITHISQEYIDSDPTTSRPMTVTDLKRVLEDARISDIPDEAYVKVSRSIDSANSVRGVLFSWSNTIDINDESEKEKEKLPSEVSEEDIATAEWNERHYAERELTNGIIKLCNGDDPGNHLTYQVMQLIDRLVVEVLK